MGSCVSKSNLNVKENRSQQSPQRETSSDLNNTLHSIKTVQSAEVCAVMSGVANFNVQTGSEKQSTENVFDIEEVAIGNVHQEAFEINFYPQRTADRFIDERFHVGIDTLVESLSGDPPLCSSKTSHSTVVEEEPFEVFVAFFRFFDLAVGISQSVPVVPEVGNRSSSVKYMNDNQDESSCSPVTPSHFTISRVVFLVENGADFSGLKVFDSCRILSKSVMAHFVLYPNLIGDFLNYRKYFLRRQIEKFSSSFNISIPLTSSMGNIKSFLSKSQTSSYTSDWMWKALINPPSSDMYNFTNIDVVVILCQRIILFLISFLQSPKNSQLSMSPRNYPTSTSQLLRFSHQRNGVSNFIKSIVSSFGLTEWNAERRSLRASYYMAEQYLLETLSFLAKFYSENSEILTKNDSKHFRMAFKILPSYVETKELFCIPVEQGGIDGPSFLPSSNKGSLVANYDKKKAFLSLHNEIGALCNGLLWKTIIREGEGWRLPTPLCVANLSTVVVDTKEFVCSQTIKDSLGNQLLNSFDKNQCSNCSLFLSSFAQNSFRSNFLSFSLGISDPNLSFLILPYLQNTLHNISADLLGIFDCLLCQAFRVTCRSMKQGEICLISIPIVDLLDEVLRFPEVTHINFDPILKGSSSSNGGLLFLIQLNSWFPLFFFSAPNGHPEINDVKVEAIEEAVLSVDSFNRTITFTSDIDIDQIPKPLDRITIGIRDQNSLNEDKVHFVLPSSSSPTAANHDADEVNGVPTILQKAIQNLTVGSSGRLALPSSMLNGSFWENHKIRKIQIDPNNHLKCSSHSTEYSVLYFRILQIENTSKSHHKSDSVSYSLLDLLNDEQQFSQCCISSCLLPYIESLLAITEFTQTFETSLETIAKEIFSASSVVEGFAVVLKQFETTQAENSQYVKLWKRSLDLIGNNPLSSKTGEQNFLSVFLSSIDYESLCLPTSIHLNQAKCSYTIGGVHLSIPQAGDIGSLCITDTLHSQLQLSRLLYSDFILQGSTQPLVGVAECMGRICWGFPKVPTNWTRYHSVAGRTYDYDTPGFTNEFPLSSWDECTNYLIARNFQYRPYSELCLSELSGCGSLLTIPYKPCISHPSALEKILHFIQIATPPCLLPKNHNNGITTFPVQLLPPNLCLPSSNLPFQSLISQELQFLCTQLSLSLPALGSNMINNGVPEFQLKHSLNDDNLTDFANWMLLFLKYDQTKRVNEIHANNEFQKNIGNRGRDQGAIDCNIYDNEMNLQSNGALNLSHNNNSIGRVEGTTPVAFLWNLSSEDLKVVEIIDYEQLIELIYYEPISKIIPEKHLRRIKNIMRSNLHYVDIAPLSSNLILNFLVHRSELSTLKESLVENLLTISGLLFSLWKVKESSFSAILFIPILIHSTALTSSRPETLIRRLRALSVPLSESNKKQTNESIFLKEKLSNIKTLVANAPVGSFVALDNHQIKFQPSFLYVEEKIRRTRFLLKRFEILTLTGFWGLFIESNPNESNQIPETTFSAKADFFIPSISLYLLAVAFKEVLRLLTKLDYSIDPEFLIVFIVVLPELFLERTSSCKHFPHNFVLLKNFIFVSLSALFIRCSASLHASGIATPNLVSCIDLAKAVCRTATVLPHACVTTYLFEYFLIHSNQISLETLLAHNLTPDSARKFNPFPKFTFKTKSNSIKYSSACELIKLRFCSYHSCIRYLELIRMENPITLSSLKSAPHETDLFIRRMKAFSSKFSHHKESAVLSSFRHFMFSACQSWTAALQLYKANPEVFSFVENVPPPIFPDLTDFITHWQILCCNRSFIPEQKLQKVCETSSIDANNLPRKAFIFNASVMLELCRRLLSLSFSTLIKFNPLLVQNPGLKTVSASDQIAIKQPSHYSVTEQTLDRLLRTFSLWLPDAIAIVRTMLLSASELGASIPVEFVVGLLICDGLYRLIFTGDIEAGFALHQQALRASTFFSQHHYSPLNTQISNELNHEKLQRIDQILHTKLIKYLNAGSDLEDALSSEIKQQQITLRPFMPERSGCSDLLNMYEGPVVFGKIYHPVVLYISYVLSSIAYLRNFDVKEIEKYNFIFRNCRLIYSTCPFAIGPPERIPKNMKNFYHSIIRRLRYPLYSNSQNETDQKQSLTRINQRQPEPSQQHVKEELCEEGQTNEPGFTGKENAKNCDIVDTLLWNFSLIGPDLIAWFDSIDFLSHTNSSPLLLEDLYQTDYLSQKLDLPQSKETKVEQLKKRFSLSGPVRTATEGLSYALLNVSCHVFMLGANFVAGCLGVGRPKYFRHDEQMYDLFPNYRNENCLLQSSGVDVWWSGVPVKVPRLEDANIVGLACGEHHTLAVTSSGRLFSWGSNQFGQCGVAIAVEDYNSDAIGVSGYQQFNKAFADRSRFRVTGLSLSQDIPDAVIFSKGGSESHGAFLKVDEDTLLEKSLNPSNFCSNVKYSNVDSSELSFGTHEVKGLVADLHGQASLEKDVPTDQKYNSDYLLPTAITIPVEVMRFYKHPEKHLSGTLDEEELVFTEISAGGAFSAALTRDGLLYLWGNASDGCLGRNSLMKNNILHDHHPTQLYGETVANDLLDEIKRSPSSGFNSISWARKIEIQNYLYAYYFSRLHRISKIRCGLMHAGAVDCKGGLWMWGLGEAGQLGFPYEFIRFISSITSRSSLSHQPPDKTLELPKATFTREDSLEIMTMHHPCVISSPHRLRIFCIPIRCDVSNCGRDTSSYDEIVRDYFDIQNTLHQFFKSLGIKVAKEMFGLISCRHCKKNRKLIVTLTDYFLLRYSSLELRNLFTQAICHPCEVQFVSVACGEGHSIAQGFVKFASNNDEPQQQQKQKSLSTSRLQRETETSNTSWESKYPAQQQQSLSSMPQPEDFHLLLSWGQYSFGQLGVDFISNEQPLLSLSALLLSDGEINHSVSPQRSSRRNNHWLMNKVNGQLLYEDEGEITRSTACLIFSWTPSAFRELLNQLPYGVRCNNLLNEKLKDDEHANRKQISVRDLHAGGCSNLLLLSNGKALVWGSNDFGVIGVGEYETREIRTPVFLNLPKQSPMAVAITHASFAVGAPRLFIVFSDGSFYILGKDSYGSSGCYSNLTKPQAQLFHEQKISADKPFRSGVFKVKIPECSEGDIYTIQCVAGGAMHTAVSVRKPVTASETSNSLQRSVALNYIDLLSEDQKNHNNFKGIIPKHSLSESVTKTVVVLPSNSIRLNESNENPYYQAKQTNNDNNGFRMSYSDNLMSRFSRIPSLGIGLTDGQWLMPELSKVPKILQSIGRTHESVSASRLPPHDIHKVDYDKSKRPKTSLETLHTTQQNILNSQLFIPQLSESFLSSIGEKKCHKTQAAAEKGLKYTDNEQPIKKFHSEILFDKLSALDDFLSCGLRGIGDFVSGTAKKKVGKPTSRKTSFDLNVKGSSLTAAPTSSSEQSIKKMERRFSYPATTINDYKHETGCGAVNKNVSRRKNDSIGEYAKVYHQTPERDSYENHWTSLDFISRSNREQNVYPRQHSNQLINAPLDSLRKNYNCLAVWHNNRNDSFSPTSSGGISLNRHMPPSREEAYTRQNIMYYNPEPFKTPRYIPPIQTLPPPIISSSSNLQYLKPNDVIINNHDLMARRGLNNYDSRLFPQYLYDAPPFPQSCSTYPSSSTQTQMLWSGQHFLSGVSPDIQLPNLPYVKPLDNRGYTIIPSGQASLNCQQQCGNNLFDRINNPINNNL